MKNKIIYLYILISLISIIVVFNFMNNNSYSVTDEYVYGLTAPRGRILDRNYNVIVDNVGTNIISYKKEANVSVKDEIDYAYL